MAASAWAGGYLLFVLVLVPLLRRETTASLMRVAVTTVRTMTYAGVGTLIFGTLLITRTRGFASLGRGEWGWLIIACIVIAIALLGIGDGALRPQLRKLAHAQPAPMLERVAWLGLALSALAIILMTRALYAGN